MESSDHKKMLRRMRFKSDQAGIMDRYLREQDHWDIHLEKTKQFIRDSFQNKRIKTVAVLGSGWLLDLPLEDLANRFQELLLVDIFHPPQVRKKVEKYKNVTLFETDLTGGGIGFCWQLKKQNKHKSADTTPIGFTPMIPALPLDPDAFISLNILNQLDTLLVEYMERKKFHLPEDVIIGFRKNIQQFHLDWITGKPGCLVTDVAELNSGLNEAENEKILIHATLPHGIRFGEWTWDFDLSGTYHPGKETRLKVRAIEW